MRVSFILLLLTTSAFLKAQDVKLSSGDLSANYIIRPLDYIQVTVFQEPDFNIQSRLSATGNIALPLIGEVKVAGMTVNDARLLITRLLDADYIVNPQVTVLILQYQERRVHIHGQVNRPGPVIIPPEEDMTLSQAISGAGGLTRIGDGSEISIKRDKPDGSSEVVRVNYKDILRDPASRDIPVYDGDNIYVKETIF